MQANRTGDRRALRTAVRALTYVVRRTSPRSRLRSVFEAGAVAAAYNLLRARQPAAFALVKKEWAAWMRRVKTLRIQRYDLVSNKSVVEAVAILELLDSRVRSSDATTIVGNRKRARKLATRLLLRRVPDLRATDALIMSDRIDYPLAYHALSMAFYARAAHLLGKSAPPVIRRTVVRLAEASLELTAPDGETAYNGHSQDQVWTLTGTVYGASEAARYAPAKAPAFLALAERALGRMADRYPVTSGGQLMVPAMVSQPLSLYRGALDRYANGVSYAGLAAMFLGRAVEDGPNVPSRVSSGIPADEPRFAAALSQENGRFAVVRRGDLWFAVKGKRAGRSQWSADYRYDFGLVVAKRLEGGSWRDVAPIKPRTTGTQPVSAGPVVQIGGRTGFPAGELEVSPDGSVEIRGGYFAADGSLLRTATFRYQPVEGCVVLTTDARAGETYLVGAFFTGTPRMEGLAIRDGRSELRLDRPFSVRVTGPYPSAVQLGLKLARAVVNVRSDGSLRAEYC